MRSVFRDFTDEFFQILTYPKEQWNVFWQKYKQSIDVIEPLMKKQGLSDEEVINIFRKMGRKELDKAYWYRQEIIREFKSEIIAELTKNPDKLQVNRGDYAVYLVCFLGQKPYEFLDSFKGTVIAVDFLYIYLNKDRINPKDLVVEAILNFVSTVPQNTKKADFWVLYDKILTIVTNSNYKTKEEVMQRIVELLSERIDYYNWVGFYLVDNKDKGLLTLGPFVGEPTEHEKIKFGQGICGQAASSKKTFIVGDVTKEENYLSCSPKTKSEIVVPIFDKKGNIVGEIDIDSHQKDAFDQDDKLFLEEIARLITDRFY
ncbi:MAG TPA: GAF domain-containing protein [Defluviitoga tunisiensis]|nr:GAF domain-containing protein [Defluviitoga tunisiensis]HPZ66520.1 GAF domain-containing protein [Defluviitoga tunisiensis]